MTDTYWKNKNVVITGGTSGLGKELVMQLINKGANILTVARDQVKLDKLKTEIPTVIIVKGDISDKDLIYRLSGLIFGTLGGVDVLINNASYLGITPLKSLNDTECEDLEQVLQTNLLGPFRLTKALMSKLILQNSGLVINISSDAAVQAYPNWGSYSVSKAALDQLTRIWSEELKDTEVRFVSLDPGDMATPMHFDAIPDANRDELYDPKDVAVDLIQFIETLISKSARKSDDSDNQVNSKSDEPNQSNYLTGSRKVRYASDEWRSFL